MRVYQGRTFINSQPFSHSVESICVIVEIGLIAMLSHVGRNQWKALSVGGD